MDRIVEPSPDAGCGERAALVCSQDLAPGERVYVINTGASGIVQESDNRDVPMILFDGDEKAVPMDRWRLCRNPPVGGWNSGAMGTTS